MLSKPFTFRRVEGLRSVIQQVTDECIDQILAGPQPADMVAVAKLLDAIYESSREGKRVAVEV